MLIYKINSKENTILPLSPEFARVRGGAIVGAPFLGFLLGDRLRSPIIIKSQKKSDLRRPDRPAWALPGGRARPKK